MSEHLHSTYVSGCFRCELSRDEAMESMAEELTARRESMHQIFWLNTHPTIDKICKDVYNEWGGIHG